MQKNIPSALKLSNRKQIYYLLSQKDGISRADLARETGISGATVVKAIDFLRKRNIILFEETEESPAHAGRKPTPLRFNRDFAASLIVYMEGLYTSIGIVNAAGDVLLSQEFKITNLESFFQEEIFDHIDSILAKNILPFSAFLGIGIAIPAAVDIKGKQIMCSPLLKGCHLDNLEQWIKTLELHYKLPVFVENDVNVAALGEYRSRFGRSFGDLVYLSLGSGLGAGIILNGQIRRGQHFCAGEIGYMVFDPKEENTATDMGWLENHINLDAITRQFQAGIKELVLGRISEEICQYLASYIALAVINIHAVIDVETILLGGVLADYFSTPLLAAVNQEIAQKMPHFPIPQVQLGQLKQPGFSGFGHIILDNLIDKILESQED